MLIMYLYQFFNMLPSTKRTRKLKKDKVYTPLRYNETERNKKVMLIRMELVEYRMDHVLTPEIMVKINNFIKTGEDYIDTIHLPEYSRKMEIQFINDKKQQSFIRFKFIKIRVEGEDDENPINKLNKLQEEII